MPWPLYNDAKVRVGDPVSALATFNNVGPFSAGATLISTGPPIWAVYRYDPFSVLNGEGDCSLILIASSGVIKQGVFVLPVNYGIRGATMYPVTATPAGDNSNGWAVSLGADLDIDADSLDTTLEISQGLGAAPGFYAAVYYLPYTVSDPILGVIRQTAFITSQRFYSLGNPYNVAFIVGMDYMVSPTTFQVPFGTGSVASTIAITGNPLLNTDAIQSVQYDGNIPQVTGTVPSYDQYLGFNVGALDRRVTNSITASQALTGAQEGQTYTFTVALDPGNYFAAGTAAHAATSSGFVGAPPQGGLPSLNNDYNPNSLLFDQGPITITITIGGVTPPPPPPPPPPQEIDVLQATNDALGQPVFIGINGQDFTAALYISRDAGATYQGYTLPPEARCAALVISPLSNMPRVVYLDKVSGRVQQITTTGDGSNGGWAAARDIGPSAQNFSLTQLPGKPEIVYLVVQYGNGFTLCQSMDGGATYKAIGQFASGIARGTTATPPAVVTIGTLVVCMAVDFHGRAFSVSTTEQVASNQVVFTDPVVIAEGWVSITAVEFRGMIWAAGADIEGGVHLMVSRDIGQTWTALPDPNGITLPIALAVWRDSGRLMLNPLSYSDDGGMTWIVAS